MENTDTDGGSKEDRETWVDLSPAHIPEPEGQGLGRVEVGPSPVSMRIGHQALRSSLCSIGVAIAD